VNEDVTRKRVVERRDTSGKQSSLDMAGGGGEGADGGRERDCEEKSVGMKFAKSTEANEEWTATMADTRTGEV
jgi:hypothetical protein